MWPSLTGTRMQCATIAGLLARTTLPFSTRPQIFIGSFWLFSSSPPMKGITLSPISGQVSSVLPAPDSA